MNDQFEQAMKNLLGQIRPNQMKAQEAMWLTQAALNLAQAQQVLTVIGTKSKGAGS
jgi:hypothetical protein